MTVKVHLAWMKLLIHFLLSIHMYVVYVSALIRHSDEYMHSLNRRIASLFSEAAWIMFVCRRCLSIKLFGYCLQLTSLMVDGYSPWFITVYQNVHQLICFGVQISIMCCSHLFSGTDYKYIRDWPLSTQRNRSINS